MLLNNWSPPIWVGSGWHELNMPSHTSSFMVSGHRRPGAAERSPIFQMRKMRCWKRLTQGQQLESQPHVYVSPKTVCLSTVCEWLPGAFCSCLVWLVDSFGLSLSSFPRMGCWCPLRGDRVASHPKMSYPTEALSPQNQPLASLSGAMVLQRYTKGQEWQAPVSKLCKRFWAPVRDACEEALHSSCVSQQHARPLPSEAPHLTQLCCPEVWLRMRQWTSAKEQGRLLAQQVVQQSQLEKEKEKMGKD